MSWNVNASRLFDLLLVAYVVTEVVWEETETNATKKEDTDTSKKLNDGKSANAAVNRYVSIDNIAIV